MKYPRPAFSVHSIHPPAQPSRQLGIPLLILISILIVGLILMTSWRTSTEISDAADQAARAQLEESSRLARFARNPLSRNIKVVLTLPE